jgi:Glycosyl hydrolase family 99
VPELQKDHLKLKIVERNILCFVNTNPRIYIHIYLFTSCFHCYIFQFNEWHEGTQIEPAVPKTSGSFVYTSYEPENPDFYLRKTKEWTEKFANVKRSAIEAIMPASKTEDDVPSAVMISSN